MSDRLIYGKNPTERIVNIEVQENEATLFVQEHNGEVTSHRVPNKYWILTSGMPHNSWRRLKGDLHYKWGKLFENRAEFLRARYNLARYNPFSIYDPKESLMVKDGYTYFKGMKHHEVTVMAFDIETTGLVHDETSDVLLIACTLRKNGIISRRLFAYDDYRDLREFLEAFCEYVRESDPSILLGHNIFGYDLPYLHYVASREGVELRLGRDGSPLTFETYESKFRKDATQFYHYHKARVFGREFVDTLFTTIRYDVGRKYESYALKALIRAEGREVPDRVFVDASRIRFDYKDPEKWKQIKAYAVHDGDDALTLYDLTTPALFYITQSVPKSYQEILCSASGSQINAVMMRSYLQEGHSLPQASAANPYEGAISFGNPGIYRNVFKVDVASLYPNIMLEYRVFDADKDPNGNFLRLVETFTARRLEHKRLAKETGDKYFDDLQNAEKTFINSTYGTYGAPGLLFNSPAKASFITGKGREILQGAIHWAESRHFPIVNADTDSISFASQQGEGFSPDQRNELLADLNSKFPAKIHFEDDGYYPVVVVIKAKNYVLFDGKKMKTKGSALKASTKEPALKQFILDLQQEMIEGNMAPDFHDHLRKIYEKYVLEICNLTDIKRWATRKTITENVLNAKRTNEQKVKDAIEESEYVAGDRAYFYFKSDGSLCLAENFDGDYDLKKLLEKLYKTAEIFDTVLDVKTLFPNYKLKRNQPKLEQLCASFSSTSRSSLAS